MAGGCSTALRERGGGRGGEKSPLTDAVQETESEVEPRKVTGSLRFRDDGSWKSHIPDPIRIVKD